MSPWEPILTAVLSWPPDKAILGMAALGGWVAAWRFWLHERRLYERLYRVARHGTTLNAVAAERIASARAGRPRARLDSSIPPGLPPKLPKPRRDRAEALSAVQAALRTSRRQLGAVVSEAEAVLRSVQRTSDLPPPEDHEPTDPHS